MNRPGLSVMVDLVAVAVRLLRQVFFKKNSPLVSTEFGADCFIERRCQWVLWFLGLGQLPDSLLLV